LWIKNNEGPGLFVFPYKHLLYHAWRVILEAINILDGIWFGKVTLGMVISLGANILWLLKPQEQVSLHGFVSGIL